MLYFVNVMYELINLSHAGHVGTTTAKFPNIHCALAKLIAFSPSFLPMIYYFNCIACFSQIRNAWSMIYHHITFIIIICIHAFYE